MYICLFRYSCFVKKLTHNWTTLFKPRRFLMDNFHFLAWNWLEECGKLMQDLSFRNQFSRTVTFPGIRTALGLDRKLASSTSASGVGPRSDIVYRHWNIGRGSNPDPQDDSVGRPKKTFRSEGRENALRLCGWGVPDVEPGL
jgi:hypothetical protein